MVELLTELAQLYHDVDEAYADWSCPGSTECCRFGVTGRQPYVTSIELAALRRAIARRGGLPGPRKRALPLVAGRDERVCPLLDLAGRCVVYADRPIGCRTFYCDRASRGAGPDRDLLRGFMARLRDLAARHTLGGEEGRPLVRALE